MAKMSAGRVKGDFPDGRDRWMPWIPLCRSHDTSLGAGPAGARSRPANCTAARPFPKCRCLHVELSSLPPATSPGTEPPDFTEWTEATSTRSLQSLLVSGLILPMPPAGAARVGFCGALVLALLSASCRPSDQRYKILQSGSEIKRPECVSCEGLGYAPPMVICGRCSGTGLDQRHTAAWPEPPHPMWHTGRPYGEPEKPPQPPKTEER